jgi:hypothetical protein
VLRDAHVHRPRGGDELVVREPAGWEGARGGGEELVEGVLGGDLFCQAVSVDGRGRVVIRRNGRERNK